VVICKQIFHNGQPRYGGDLRLVFP